MSTRKHKKSASASESGATNPIKFNQSNQFINKKEELVKKMCEQPPSMVTRLEGKINDPKTDAECRIIEIKEGKECLEGLSKELKKNIGQIQELKKNIEQIQTERGKQVQRAMDATTTNECDRQLLDTSMPISKEDLKNQLGKQSFIISENDAADEIFDVYDEHCPITTINPDGTIVEHANPSLINETQSPFHINTNSKPHKFITDRTAMMDETTKRIQKLINLAPKLETKETKKKRGKIEPKPVTIVKYVYDYLKLTAKSEEELKLVKKLQDRPLKKIEDIEKQDNDLRLKEQVEDAKQQAKLHHKDIILNASNMVALVNLYDKHPFYFITPGEARMAIDYIKDIREDNIKNFEYCRIQDTLVRACIQTVVRKKKFKAWEKNDGLIRSLYGEDESPIIDIPRAAKRSRSKEEYQDKIIREVQKTMAKTQNSTIQNQELPNINVFSLTDNKFLNITSTNRAFRSIDKLFVKFESYEAVVDSIIINPNSYYESLRHIGGINEYSAKDRNQREKENKVRAVATLFTADVYVDSAIKRNQIILGSSNGENKVVFLNAELDLGE